MILDNVATISSIRKLRCFDTSPEDILLFKIGGWQKNVIFRFGEHVYAYISGLFGLEYLYNAVFLK